MKINHAIETSTEKIIQGKIDYIFCMSGFETRARYFSEIHLDYIKHIPNKICFCFDDRKVLSRSKNDKFFITNGFQLIDCQSGNLMVMVNLYREILSKHQEDTIELLIDYSSMTRVMYAALIKFFSHEDQFKKAVINFCYTPALYTEPNPSESNLHNQPIPLFPTVEMTDKKISLLLGLGYEEDQGQGLVEFMQIDNNDIYLFYTQANNDKKFYQKVIENNDFLLKSIPLENQFEYDLFNITKITNLLNTLCSYLFSKEYRVIIAPLGPKPFALISILLTLKFNDLTVLRVSQGIKGVPTDKLPDKNVKTITLTAVFCNELEDSSNS